MWAARPCPRCIPEPGTDARAALAAMAGARRQLRQQSLGVAATGEEENPGAAPVRAGPVSPSASRARRDGADGCGGIAEPGIVPELFTAPSDWSSQSCNATPPSSLWRDIHTPPAPYAACALTQGVGTGCCHLLCHVPGHGARERQKAQPRLGPTHRANAVVKQGLGSLKELKATCARTWWCLGHAVEWTRIQPTPTMESDGEGCTEPMGEQAMHREHIQAAEQIQVLEMLNGTAKKQAASSGSAGAGGSFESPSRHCIIAGASGAGDGLK